MTPCTDLRNVQRVSALVQSCCNVIIEPVDKILVLMTDPASAECLLGDAGPHPLKERDRPVERVVVTVLTAGIIFLELFFLTFFVGYPVNAIINKGLNILMRELLFA